MTEPGLHPAWPADIGLALDLMVRKINYFFSYDIDINTTSIYRVVGTFSKYCMLINIMNYWTDFSRAFDLKWSEKINYHFFINDKSCCMKNAILLLFVAAVVLKSFEHDLFICI